MPYPYLSAEQNAIRAGCTLLARRIRRCGTYATLRYCAKQGISLELALFIFAGRNILAESRSVAGCQPLRASQARGERSERNPRHLRSLLSN